MPRALAALLASFALCAAAAEPSLEAHGQATYLWQRHPGFRSLYSGPNSLSQDAERGYTFSSTLFLGARLGDTELYFNPEFVQGLPFSGLHGLGGFTNGENQRGAGTQLRGYRARLFARHTWNLSGDYEEQPSEANQVKTRYAAERIVLTAGNLSVLDVFDAVEYSHDPRTQFANWSSLTYGAWDYAADARGYTWGAALEYIHPKWQVRAGRFLVPVESNGIRLDWTFLRRYSDAVELELPYRLAGRAAPVSLMGFQTRVTAGSYGDALAAAARNGGPPSVGDVHTSHTKRGAGIGTQVAVTDDIGAYVRAGWSDGKTETFMFTEIDRSLAAGALVKGTGWGRPGDTLGLAGYLNGLSRQHRDYLAAGGLGFFLGDGRLNYGPEAILETFYSLGLRRGFALSLDYQRVRHPGYNRDRGPVDVIGARLHAEF